jgi:hypothetical protein
MRSKHARSTKRLGVLILFQLGITFAGTSASARDPATIVLATGYLTLM